MYQFFAGGLMFGLALPIAILWALYRGSMAYRAWKHRSPDVLYLPVLGRALLVVASLPATSVGGNPLGNRFSGVVFGVALGLLVAAYARIAHALRRRAAEQSLHKRSFRRPYYGAAPDFRPFHEPRADALPTHAAHAPGLPHDNEQKSRGEQLPGANSLAPSAWRLNAKDTRDIMKILHLLSTVDPRAGGPTEGVLQSGLSMRAIGHDIEVVSLDTPDAPYVADFKLPLHALGPSHGFYGLCPHVPWLQENASRFDAVIVNGLWQYQSYGAWKALRGGGVPYYVFRTACSIRGSSEPIRSSICRNACIGRGPNIACCAMRSACSSRRRKSACSHANRSGCIARTKKSSRSARVSRRTMRHRCATRFSRSFRI